MVATEHEKRDDHTTQSTQTTQTGHPGRLTMHDRMHMPRSRGAASGLLVVLLGVWGGLVPFAGPAFGYSFTPDVSWQWTTGRLLLEVIPAAATVLGGLAMMGSASRISGAFGAWLAAAGGAWFVVGQWVSTLWNHGVMQAGTPTASTDAGRVAEWLGFFLGLGVLIVFLAAMALGRMSVVSVRDVERVRERRLDDEAVAQDEHDDRDDRDDHDDRGSTLTSTRGRRVREDTDRRR
jgi:hypothetical protein